MTPGQPTDYMTKDKHRHGGQSGDVETARDQDTGEQTEIISQERKQKQTHDTRGNYCKKIKQEVGTTPKERNTDA